MYKLGTRIVECVHGSFVLDMFEFRLPQLQCNVVLLHTSWYNLSLGKRGTRMQSLRPLRSLCSPPLVSICIVGRFWVCRTQIHMRDQGKAMTCGNQLAYTVIMIINTTSRLYRYRLCAYKIICAHIRRMKHIIMA